MIKNFEEYTYELTDNEKKMLPLIIQGFKNYSIKNTIKEPLIVSRFNQRNTNLKLTAVRLRKLVNYIRVHSLLPLIATSKGYFVCYNKTIINTQIQSLRQRANSIDNCANGLEKLL